MSAPVWVILPTYQEAGNLERIVRAELAAVPGARVLVVDDSSPDGTGAIADALAAEHEAVDVLHRPCKSGLGRAYVAGFAHALRSGAGTIVEMDADFSHDPRHLPEFLALVGELDVVIGSRYMRGVTVVNWPMGRLLLSWLANWYARIVTGLPLHDLTSGYKCYRRQVLERLDIDAIRSNGYAFQIETVFRAWHSGFAVGEMPIVFVDRNVGSSKMSKRIVWEAIWMVWRMRLWKLTGRLRHEVVYVEKAL